MKTFYLPPDEWTAPFELTGPEAHHLGRVLRTAEGETVRGIDGAGRSALFTVQRVEKRRIALDLEQEEALGAPAPRVTLAVGFSKSARRGWLLEKAVELRAAEVWFWQAARSQGKVPHAPKERWTTDLVAGAKQCGNPLLPRLAVHPGLDAVIAAGRDYPRKYLLWEDQDAPAVLPPADVLDAGEDVLCVLGPEGGFAPAEVDALRAAGYAPVSLGPSVLRVETAALAALTLFWWGGSHA